jgi:general secretion pathway protein E/type IV pilus assembly protein PilB
VEFHFEHVTQTQVAPQIGLTFARALRSFLRQDPDVILVGEMRDSETAQIAMQAALTGHMVMSTLHTASTVETIVRLVDLGIEPWIVANALSAVLAQRLLRNVCPHCQEGVRLDADLWDEDELLAPRGTKVVRPRGCPKCHGTGYRGRTGIFEVLVADDEVRELIKNKASPRDYRALLDTRKVPRLRKLAFQRVREGVTTVDELLRVT